ncbi:MULTISPECIES: 16S rRNA (guanine(966)-N(2))-methyltransferase RsmD [Actinoalloteichus]|uniref:16S rRNA (Guanine(966)-N(2))-methyltransferase RsmD n=1 Tax=Actinoalloteichus fjordicus TaxID=1612552 RepID=A0AAC9LG76_9PSEU|nr:MULTISPECIES: 16S rRNA (guanine(966)-N(2))-methyltransferase RsmD [Actinoalloteichus]APU17131.1 16S rRNA (guanine(966)-N(2))-methyltransferase RsmD [Actinoalloteichus fjordicus]APU23213.1 16S rRNA (guanine(966)-N(2))-methyltransferase RsmD [Actinoalloteichus sp. GBA129-24]
MTRIVAGSMGGRRITVPPRGTRPTSERVREALFNAVESLLDLRDVRVLDLYAGSGALGLEALSRGAGEAVFVESDRRAGLVLRRNIDTLRPGGAVVRSGTVESVLSAPAEQPFDLVLADPPYDVPTDGLESVLGLLVHQGWTRPGSLVVVERAVRDRPPRWPSPLQALREKRYGDTVLFWGDHDEEHGDDRGDAAS